MYQFSPVNRGSCSEQSITSRRMFFQRSPVSGTKQRLCRQDEGSRATGDSLGADKFSDGHAIVIRHSSIPPPRLRGRHGVRGRIARWRTAERLAARAIDSSTRLRQRCWPPAVSKSSCVWRTCHKPATRMFSGKRFAVSPDWIRIIMSSDPPAIRQRWRPNWPLVAAEIRRAMASLACDHGEGREPTPETRRFRHRVRWRKRSRFMGQPV